MDVSENRGTPKSSILIGFSIINHPFWGTTTFGNTHIERDWFQKNRVPFSAQQCLGFVIFFTSKTTPLEWFFIVGGVGV